MNFYCGDISARLSFVLVWQLVDKRVRRTPLLNWRPPTIYSHVLKTFHVVFTIRLRFCGDMHCGKGHDQSTLMAHGPIQPFSSIEVPVMAVE